MEGTMTVGDIVNSLMSVDKNEDESSDELEKTVWLPELQGTQHVAPHAPTGAPHSTSATVSAPSAAPTNHYHHRRNGSLINRSQLPPHGSGKMLADILKDVRRFRMILSLVHYY